MKKFFKITSLHVSAKVEAGEDPAATLGSREDSEENEMSEMLEELFGSVMTVTDAADPTRLLHLMFRLLPSQKRYPEYYKVISEPIDLKIIATKIVENKYTNMNQLEDDIGQMCKNAQMFNEPGSQIYKDARIILKTVKQKKFELEANKVARENRGSRSTRRVQTAKKQYSAEVIKHFLALTKIIFKTVFRSLTCLMKTARAKKAPRAKKASTKRTLYGRCSAQFAITKPAVVAHSPNPF